MPVKERLDREQAIVWHQPRVVVGEHGGLATVFGASSHSRPATVAALATAKAVLEGATEGSSRANCTMYQTAYESAHGIYQLCPGMEGRAGGSW